MVKNPRISNLVKGLFAFFFFLFIQYYIADILTLFHVDVASLSAGAKTAISFGIDILLMVVMFIIYRQELKEDFEKMKEHHKTYFSTCFKYWIYALITMVISNYLILIFSGSELPNNEEAIRQMFTVSPIYTFLSAVFYAPFVEELVFRKSLRNIFNNDILFVLFSGLIFGGMHIIGNFSSLTDLLYIIPYGAPGVFFAMMLIKTDNIFTSMGFHFMHNGILMSLQFILLIFG